MANIATCALSLQPWIGRHLLRNGPDSLPFASYRAPASQWSGNLFHPEEVPLAPGYIRGAIVQWAGSPDGPKIRVARELLLSLAAEGHGCVWVEAQAGGATVPPRLLPGWGWARTGLYTAFSMRETGPSLPYPVRAGGAGPMAGNRKQQLRDALRAVEQLLDDRRWAVVVLHLGRWAPSELRDIPKWTWFRLQAGVRTGGTGLIVLVDRRCGRFGVEKVHQFETRRLPEAGFKASRTRPEKANPAPGRRKLRVSRPLPKPPATEVVERGSERASGSQSPDKPFLVLRVSKRSPSDG